MCSSSDFNSVWSHLPSCFSKGLQKRDFLDIYLTMVFGGRTFKNISPMIVIVFLKMFKV